MSQKDSKTLKIQFMEQRQKKINKPMFWMGIAMIVISVVLFLTVDRDQGITPAVLAFLGIISIGASRYRPWKWYMKKNRFVRIAKKLPLIKSVITCPKCGFEKEEKMPTDSCQFFWECSNCKTLLKPKKGDCCVFCSYGSVPCPPVQMEGSCCP